MSFLARFILITATCVATSGCATVLRQVADGLEADVQAQAEAQGVALVFAPRRSAFGWQEGVGWTLDAYVAVNVINIAIEYESQLLAAGAMAAAGGGAVLADVLGRGVFPAATPKTAHLAWNVGDRRVDREVALTPLVDGRYRAFLPKADLAGITSDLACSLRAKGGNELGREIVPSSMVAQALAAASPGGKDDLVERRDEVDVAPTRAANNPDALGVVIGIERYAEDVPPVTFARRDASTFRSYLEKTLGVPRENIVTLLDEKATSAAIRTAIEGQLRSRIADGKSDVYVYFAGHGVPDVKTQTPYLVPYDGNPAYPETSCYPLASAYQALGRLPSRSVTVVLDSCFSGAAGRSSGRETLVKGARPLMLETKQSAVPKGLTVFAAATGSQISSALEPAGHGIFTYYFLQGLRGKADANRDERVTNEEMQDYLVANVAKAARRLNREQTPVLLGQDEDRTLIRF